MLDLFLAKSRGKNMVCVLETPDKEIDKNSLVIFCHGFVGHKITPHRMAPNLSRTLALNGFSTLRADTVGAGDSEGDSSYMTIPGEVEDHLVAFSEIKKQRNWDKVILLGYSMGGTIASLLTEKIKSNALVLWSPVSDPYWNFYHILGEDVFKRGIEGEDVSIDGDYVSKNFFVGLRDIDPLSVLKFYENPVKIIHGSKDTDVLSINAFNYKQAAKNSILHFIENADHTYSNILFQEELIDETVSFINGI